MELNKMIVLIDADNASYAKLETIFLKLSVYGRIVGKKAFGNWSKPELKNWEQEVKRLAIKAEQQFDFVKGKSTTDMAMTINAMDLLHTGLYDAFALVSSDSDFAPLAVRLRESGVFVIGVGEKKTPESFRNSCDEFILTEYLDNTTVGEAKDEAKNLDVETVPAARTEVAKQGTASDEKMPTTAVDKNLQEVFALLEIASKEYQDEEGFVNFATVGFYLKRAKPDFTPRTYGYAKLHELVKDFPQRFEVKRYAGKGGGTIIAYKCL